MGVDRCEGVDTFEVIATGPQTLIQDRGRAGFASVGVCASGSFDRLSAARANHAVGNDPACAVLEVLMGGLELRALRSAMLIVTGVACSVTVLPSSGQPARRLFSNRVVDVAEGDCINIGMFSAGMRGYVGVRGGVRAAKVLGSCSTDVMSGLGPAPLTQGDVLAVGVAESGWHPALRELTPLWRAGQRVVELEVIMGPRDGWFRDPAALCSQTFTVGSDSNRVGVRLAAAHPLERVVDQELASEGTVRGAIQVPPNGHPVIFGPDHPVTGGYPVIGVLSGRSSDRCAQLAPGDLVRFRRRQVQNFTK